MNRENFFFAAWDAVQKLAFGPCSQLSYPAPDRNVFSNRVTNEPNFPQAEMGTHNAAYFRLCNPLLPATGPPDANWCPVRQAIDFRNNRGGKFKCRHYVDAVSVTAPVSLIV